MLKKAVRAGAVVAVVLVATVSGMYISNRAPVVARLAAADTASGKPFVIKLHAQWCVFCMMTKDEWSQIEETYIGRVNLVVFDFTTDERTTASAAEARRLGLGAHFDDFLGVTGSVLVIDGRTKEVVAEVNGNQDFDAYRSAIDAALLARR